MALLPVCFWSKTLSHTHWMASYILYISLSMAFNCSLLHGPNADVGAGDAPLIFTFHDPNGDAGAARLMLMRLLLHGGAKV